MRDRSHREPVLYVKKLMRQSHGGTTQAPILQPLVALFLFGESYLKSNLKYAFHGQKYFKTNSVMVGPALVWQWKSH